MVDPIFKIIIFLVTVLFISCHGNENSKSREKVLAPQQSNPYRTEKVSFTNKKDGARLFGTLTIPNIEQMYPAVVLISGSGLQDRDETVYGHKPFKVLADYLSHHNIAVLRFDDRGSGKSVGPLNNITPENFAEDAYAGVRYLQSRNDLSIQSIGLIGHSMGAVEGGILASRYSDISFLIMLGGPGIPLDENMLKADSVNNIQSGKSMAVVNSGQDLLKQMIAEAKKSQDENITERNLIEIITEWQKSLPEDLKPEIDTFTEQNPGYWENMSSEWATPYFNFVLNYDPYTTILEVSCPVLSLIGEKDVQVLPVKNSKRISDALKNGKCINYSVRIMENVNHLFQQCETGSISEYASINESFNKKVMEIMVRWIKEL